MHKAIVFISISILIVSVNTAATFSITSVSTCTAQGPTGACTRWEQNGTVTQTTGCFPGRTKVFVLQNGQRVTRKMQDIKVGDMILTSSGNHEQYTEVIGWIHKKPEAYGQYLSIHSLQGAFQTSSLHNVALLDGNYEFAQNLLGKRLSNGQIVKQINNMTVRGVYAPMTKTSNFLIDGGENQKVLVHCFAHIRNPEYYEFIFIGVWNAWEMIYGKQSSSQIHPAAEWLRNKFSFLVQQ